ncbi:hypothetical protein Q1695_011130 [Nippostrongylus brasiliensis]|nr:hypothetical protein Q1695_011130 [Nippostrongylus brasiliensis]
MHQMHSLIYESPAISSISGIFLEGQEMFISLSPATHLLISFVLHVIGISLSMFIWHLFPKNPTRYITKLPNELSLIVENVDEQAYQKTAEQTPLDRTQQTKRHFG